jgi:hypothetical protein
MGAIFIPLSKILGSEGIMAVVYVEARPRGRPVGSPITDYVVESQGDRMLGAFATQNDAISWAKTNGHTPTSLASGT